MYKGSNTRTPCPVIQTRVCLFRDILVCLQLVLCFIMLCYVTTKHVQGFQHENTTPCDMHKGLLIQ